MPTWRENPGWDMKRLLERTGVEERRIAGPTETALDLGIALVWHWPLRCFEAR